MRSNSPQTIYSLLAALILAGCMADGGSGDDPGKDDRTWYDTAYYPGGKVETITMMRDSVKHGFFLTFYETGERMKQGHYVNDGKLGWYFTWWRNGKLNHEWFLKQGELYPICWKSWDENGATTRDDACDADNYRDSTYRQLTGL